MTSSDEPIDPVKSITFLERFYESPLADQQSLGNEAENELTTEFYKSMVGYVINRMEPLSSHSSPDDPAAPATETARSETAVGELANGVRVEYVSGNVFEGQVSKYIPHGTGRLFLSNGGVTYQGRFRDGFPDGDGAVRWPDGSWYEGQFRRGLRHGRGMHVSAEDGRRRYGGRWARGKRHGPGETACDGGGGGGDGALDYAGDWADGRPHGRGAAGWPDGTRYDGGWARGRPHGRGRATWPDGDVYDGDWADGRMDGTGVYEWKNNPGDCDRLVLCLCDRYSGQWSRSRKHGVGVFYSSTTGTTVRGRWVDDVLDGPCEIVLSNGRRPSYTGLRFRQNVLYGTPPPPALTPGTAVRRGRVAMRSTAVRGRGLQASGKLARLPAAARESTTSFRWPCRQRVPQTAVSAGNDARESDGNDDGSGPVRADVPLANGETTYDLTGHVRKMAAERAANDDELYGPDGRRRRVSAVVDPESELRAAASVLEAHADRLEELYRAYGAFLADGPVCYRPLLTRLGLWQMIIDAGLHARVSLADIDDSLYENGDYAFGSAHDPFEPVYPWQFVHAVCELAITVACDEARREDCSNSSGGRDLTVASALHKLITEHLSADDVIRPKSYAAAVDGDGSWTNSRKTIARMYDVYRATTTTTTTTTTTDGPPPLPTARQLIRSYGPRASPSSLDSVLPAVLDAVFATRDAHTDGPGARAPVAVLFACTARSIAALLVEACPRVAGAAAWGGPEPRLTDAETRLTFAEWYRFVLLCVRRCDHGAAATPPSDGT